ncbi:hypothetical protein [Nocardia arthritidis]|uniref:Uncharacterized protein n=1 Tax=Nocardia arthritidis TaxID=228602 RepID=A0A6G9Y7F5_9NOCA|nr:hypothetical protein [Nocardia arthritidis]QIS09074.1 hypothetical protein F5544_05810 [Nocardia arthritidis]
MVNWLAEIEQAAAEQRRRSALLLDELDEINRRTEEKGRQLAERSAAEMRDFWEEHAEALEKAQAEAEEKERQEAEEREQREAIARSMAARKAKDTVAPIDDEDEESAYYRRDSWLV